MSLKNRPFFQNSFSSNSKIEQKVQKFPVYLSSPVHAQRPRYQHPLPHFSGTFFIIDEPPLTHSYHPKSIVYIRVQLGGVSSLGLDKCIMTCIYHYSITQSHFTAPQVFSSTYSSLPPNSLLAISDVFTISIDFCLFQNVIQLESYYVASSDLLLSFSNMHLSFLHVFSQLDSHFFFSLNDIPLCGCMIVYFSIPLLKDILVASKFWQL